MCRVTMCNLPSADQVHAGFSHNVSSICSSGSSFPSSFDATALSLLLDNAYDAQLSWEHDLMEDNAPMPTTAIVSLNSTGLICVQEVVMSRTILHICTGHQTYRPNGQHDDEISTITLSCMAQAESRAQQQKQPQRAGNSLQRQQISEVWQKWKQMRSTEASHPAWLLIYPCVQVISPES